MGSASLPSSCSSRTAALNILKVSTAIPYSTGGEFVVLIPHWALPAVRDLTRDGRLDTMKVYSSCPKPHSGKNTHARDTF
jgi:hypothetical protein